MSFVVAAPEIMTAAAGNVAGIGSAIDEATAAAAAPTTGVAAVAADEVSIAISRLFGAYGQEFQAVSAQAAAFQDQFVSLLNGGAAAYLSTEIANAEQSPMNAVNAPAQTLLNQLPSGVAAAAAEPMGGPLGQILNGAGQEIGGVVSALGNGGAASLLSDKIEAGVQAVSGAVAGAPGLRGLETALPPGLLAPGAAAVAVPGGAYAQLFTNTAANLQSLYSAWAAHPFPLLSQIVANQQVYWQQIAAALSSAIQNFPAELANLPAAIQAGIQELLAFNAALFVQQFITTQIGFAQTFVTSLNSTVTGLVAGLPAFEAGIQLAFQTLAAGNYYGAVQDLAQAFANLLVTGLDTSNSTVSTTGVFPNITLNIAANPTPLGPLADLLTSLGIPGQDAQYLTNLMPAGSIARQMSQNFTNVLNALTTPSISATVAVPLSNPQAVQYSAFFGLPLVLTYAVAGAPIATLNGVATTATAIQQALLTGNGPAAVGAFVDAPAVVANGFLNSTTVIDDTILVPTGLPAPLPTTVSVVLHLPFDGILVPPHQVTATVGLQGSAVPVPGFPTTVIVGGTPFMGIVPLLVNYVPQQLAAAITPAA